MDKYLKKWFHFAFYCYDQNLTKSNVGVGEYAWHTDKLGYSLLRATVEAEARQKLGQELEQGRGAVWLTGAHHCCSTYCFHTNKAGSQGGTDQCQVDSPNQ